MADIVDIEFEEVEPTIVEVHVDNAVTNIEVTVQEAENQIVEVHVDLDSAQAAIDAAAAAQAILDEIEDLIGGIGLQNLPSVLTAGNYVTKTKAEIDALISANELIPFQPYEITGVDADLYGGTTIYIQALNENTLCKDGFGKFFNPKYDQAIAGFGIWDDEATYEIGDKVHWGGKTWENNAGNLGIVVNPYTLDGEWTEIPFNNIDYNVAYDVIKYDIDSDVIIYRNERNNIIADCSVVFTTSSISAWVHPIKAIQWGNSLGSTGLKDVFVFSSIAELINFKGSIIDTLTVRENSRITNTIFKGTCSLSQNVFSNGSYLDASSFRGSSNLYQNTFDNLTQLANINLQGSANIRNSNTNQSVISDLYLNDSCYLNSCFFVHSIFGSKIFDTGIFYIKGNFIQADHYNDFSGAVSVSKSNFHFQGDLPTSTTATTFIVKEEGEFKEMALPTFATEEYADDLITQLINGAPSDANTLKELNDKIIAINAIIGGSTPDGDSLVNTVAELLAVFSAYPEGTDVYTILTGKVNSSDIINNLTQVVTGKVLDATQGKVLKDLIDALTAVVAGKENSSNKTNTVVGNEASTSLFLSVKGYYDYLVGLTWLTDILFGTWIHARTNKPTPIDADEFIGYNSVDGKANKFSWANIKSALSALFQARLIKQGYTSLTGVTGPSVLVSLPIPADWVEDGFEIIFTPWKSTTAASISYNLYHDTVINGTTNAIATGMVLTINQRSSFMHRILEVDSGVCRNTVTVASTSHTPAVSGTATSTTPFTKSIQNYVSLVVNPTATPEIIGINQLIIRKL